MIFPPSPPFKGCWPMSKSVFALGGIFPFARRTWYKFYVPRIFFSATRLHGHRKHLPRAFRRAWWCRRPWVDRACFLAHQGRRACRQSARRGRRRRTLLGTLAPPCRWSKNETRGWWLVPLASPAGGGKMALWQRHPADEGKRVRD